MKIALVLPEEDARGLICILRSGITVKNPLVSDDLKIRVYAWCNDQDEYLTSQGL